MIDIPASYLLYEMIDDGFAQHETPLGMLRTGSASETSRAFQCVGRAVADRLVEEGESPVRRPQVTMISNEYAFSCRYIVARAICVKIKNPAGNSS